jgi:hypothetical protein
MLLHHHMRGGPDGRGLLFDEFDDFDDFDELSQWWRGWVRRLR